ncbi:hypothetical protein GJ744_004526 [Endocarpon pusillum]|uniref:DUF7605 domain-containing protein n=1 Tax=Endocarpon pusillum TaxID=364733 RepID=A0A8H7AW16_9EURO|nr:hypothetical protein GJ744_004526 [Endocarpon pusillum]
MFCYEIPARAQFKAAHHYIWTELPSLISSIKLWIEAARSPVKQNLAKMVSAESLFSDLHKIETAWREVIEKAFAGVLSNYDGKKQEIIKGAIATCECWGKMHHSSHRAFIRKNGTHQTMTVGKRNWNRELNEHANIVLAHDWMSLDEQVATGIQCYMKLAKKSMDKIIASAIDTMAPHEFVDKMRGHQTKWHFELDIRFGEFERNLGATKRNATSGDEASYVATWMRNVYRECAQDHGDGVTARNRKRILEHVTDGLFDKLFRRIKTNLDQLALQHLNSIATIRWGIYDAIDADISVMTAPDTAVFEERPEFGQKVVKMLSATKIWLELLQDAAGRPLASAYQRGYIQDV